MKTVTDLTLVTYSTGAEMVAEVLSDWLQFLGCRPDEVIFAVSAVDTMPPVYAQLVAAGRIDRLLEVPLTGRTVNEVEPDAVRVAVRLAKTKWVLLVKMDTLPYRHGHDDWFAEDRAEVARHELFGLTGGFKMADIRPLVPGHSTTQKYSNNYALFRRAEWLQAVDDGLGADWNGPLASRAEYQGDNRRFALEAAVELYLRRTDRRMLVRHESADWSVFHVNVWGDRLRQVRESYHRRYKISPFLNDGRPPTAGQIHPWNWYYLYPKPSAFTLFRMWAGRLRRSAASAALRLWR